MEISEFLNHTPNTVTEISPHLLINSSPINRPWICENILDYQNLIFKVGQKLQRNAHRYLKRKNKSIKNKVKFNKGDMVIVKSLRVPNPRKRISKKLLFPLEGPYIIENEHAVNSYILKDPLTNRIRGIFNITQIYLFKDPNILHDN